MAVGSADKHVTSVSESDTLQPEMVERDGSDGRESGERERTASEFSPLISQAPTISETRALNPAVPQTNHASTDNSKASPDVDVASINSSHSDKDWLSHVSGLPLWASPLVRLCILLFVVGLGVTVSQPSMEVIYYKLACQSLIKNSHAPPADLRCDPVQTQQIVSTYVMWDNIIDSAVALTVCTKVSTLSDIHGRKPFLTLFIVLTTVTYYMRYFFMSSSSGFPMWGLWTATAVGSSSGGMVAFMALFKAYITDITVASERVNAISYCLVSFSVGQIGGPLLSSLLLTHARKKESPIPKIPRVSDPGILASLDPANLVPKSELIPLKASLFAFTLASIFCFVLLLESRSHKSRMKSRSASVVSLQAPRPHLPTVWSRIFHSFTSFIEPLRLLTFPSELRTEENASKFKNIRKCVLLLAVTELLFGVIMVSSMIVEPQYCIYKFKWDSVTISNFSIARSCSVIFSLAVFLPLLYKHIFPRFKSLRPVANTFDSADALVMAGGLLLYAFCHIGKAVSSNGSVFVGLAMAGSLAGVVGPVAAAAPVKFFPGSKIGEFYGAIALAQGIINLVAPMIVTKLFTTGVKKGFPGLSYVFTSSTLIICFSCVVLARYFVRERRSGSPTV
ncbi:hypothetical protein FT663_03961 [Candidozyma haemuli var. vulneris]|uniref:Major facilitator superfamily (MFS) profile domain-containing protein n=1 Tax=Candidozyma haemuli TaxID=45357 RepID=A0A2V1AWJ9_9ASCO|nr:hypothetical protein CXQ85_000692 [[Candida] haemuloni]KAF3987400.1 hypothetical protein FT662_04015 [[Candida] haemuloni var. vulneris]KAF3988605.1 hypothetical protein FT663_03961 [[Candida] haemuloni var. vulneris]PVH21703.1 hypothetical protein CXQ85_000692 [[Candida] haemuloni]